MVQTQQSNQTTGVADLHMHSTFSDGVLAPDALVNLAVKRKVSAISLTDHDTVEGLDMLSAAARTAHVDWLPGVEISAHMGRELHILGYGFDRTDTTLLAALKRQRAARIERVYAICERLEYLGKVVYAADILTDAKGNVGRPHIAKALVQAGHCRTVAAAFELYLGSGKPAFVPAATMTTHAVIGLIHNAGGIAVIAHPAVDKAIQDIPALVADGLDGVEVRHPGQSRKERTRLTALAKVHKLVMTGGSDLHVPMGQRTVGHFGVSTHTVDAIRERCLRYQ